MKHLIHAFALPPGEDGEKGKCLFCGLSYKTFIRTSNEEGKDLEEELQEIAKEGFGDVPWGCLKPVLPERKD